MDVSGDNRMLLLSQAIAKLPSTHQIGLGKSEVAIKSGFFVHVLSADCVLICDRDMMSGLLPVGRHPS